MSMSVKDLPPDPRPLLLLDVDGVINVFNRSQNHKLYSYHRVEVSNGIFKVQMRRDLKDWLFELTGHFVPVWCTMWREEANTFLAPLLELPDLPVIECKYSEQGRPDKCHDKITDIEVEVGDRPFAWVDDEITTADEAWAFLRTQSGFPTKVMKTDERMGLQRFHVDRLIAWAKEVRDVRGA